MVKSSMCALGNSFVKTKTHEGLKEVKKMYLVSALQTHTGNPKTLFSTGTSVHQVLGFYGAH